MTAVHRAGLVAAVVLAAVSASAQALESVEAGHRAAVEQSYAAWHVPSWSERI